MEAIEESRRLSYERARRIRLALGWPCIVVSAGVGTVVLTIDSFGTPDSVLGHAIQFALLLVFFLPLIVGPFLLYMTTIRTLPVSIAEGPLLVANAAFWFFAARKTGEQSSMGGLVFIGEPILAGVVVVAGILVDRLILWVESRATRRASR